MATYKLMQDIEAEDKILGPLTLRQFIFGLITAFFVYMCIFMATHKLYFLIILFAPPGLLTGFFAFPFGRDQPTEIWALAKLRYWFKPRKRIWDQSGVKELVTITVPKKIEHVYTDGLSKVEVESRLKALANTIDSRGWAVKNVNVSAYNPNPMTYASSDRLIDMSSMPQAVPDTPVNASDDILDERNNPIAQQFDTMIAQSAQNHRQQLINQMNTSTPAPQSSGSMSSPQMPMPNPPIHDDRQSTSVQPQPVDNTDDSWFMGAAPAAAGAETAEEEAIVAESRAQHDARQVTYGHMRTLQPMGSQPQAVPAAQPDPAADEPAVTDQADPAILALANNNDLNVATLARQAQKAKAPESESPDSEVVISLR